MAGYVGTLLTLAANNTNYSIYDLAYAANNQTPNKCCELQIQPIGTAMTIGDNSMNATLYGANLAANTVYTYRTQLNCIPLKSMYLRVNNATKTVAVQIITA